MKKTILRPEEILDKVFSIKKKGYDPEEVDIFLDKIQDSYETICKKLVKSKQEMIEKTGHINRLELKNGYNSTTSKIVPKEKYLHNIDDNMAKRLSSVEEKLEIILEKILETK